MCPSVPVVVAIAIVVFLSLDLQVVVMLAAILFIAPLGYGAPS